MKRTGRKTKRAFGPPIAQGSLSIRRKARASRAGDSKNAVRGYWAKELEEVIKQYGCEPPKQPEQANESEQPE
jgi:hypothetical protein